MLAKPFIASDTWASHLTTLNFSFLVCKTQTVTSHRAVITVKRNSIFKKIPSM